MDVWSVTADERVKHDSQFATLTTGTHITGEQARGFFLQSNLPQMALGQIWALADFTADGKMDRREFSIAMTLIKRQLQGHQIPSVLPPSMLREPSLGGTLPHGMSPGLSGTLPQGIASGFPLGMTTGAGGFPAMSATLPARLHTSTTQPLAAPNSPARSVDIVTDWAVPQANRLRYNQMFNKEDRKHVGYLTGLDARQLLISTGLPHNLLAQIWSLADVDGDGRLTSEEFSLAMFLSDMVKMGQTLPMTLSPNLVPPSMRSRSRSNSGIQPTGSMLVTARPADAFGDLVPSFGSSINESQSVEEVVALTHITLEDKRRENFVKGNAELERRRAELRDQQRKEEEARQAIERAEQEKKEAVRREQERKRLAEQERMMERQRQLEAEREEQRRKALEARESARKAMERQRQQEWERQRRQTLLAEKKRHEEAVQMLESQVNNLKYEIETMDNKKKELIVRIAEGKENVIRNTGYIDDMRSTRDSLISSVSTNEAARNGEERLYRKLCTDFSHVSQLLQSRQSQNPVSESFKQQQNLHSSKTQQVEKLRQQLAEIDSYKSGVVPDRDELSRLKDSLSQLQNSQTQSRTRVQTKKTEWEAEKRRRADEKIRADKELHLKEEAEKQKKLEEEQKKKEEDKWSVFKDIDFGPPAAAAAATTTPGSDSTQSSAAWESSKSTDSATSDKSADLLSTQPANQNSAQNSVWGDTGQSSSSTDLFADSSWGKPSQLGTNSWVKPTPPANDVGSKAVGKKRAALLPPPKTPQKKETFFGATESSKINVKPNVAAAVPSAVPVASTATASTAATITVHSQVSTGSVTSPVSQNRKVEIYEVQYDFEARKPDELALVMDDKVKVYPDEQESAEPGWLSGWKGDKCGIFPANYVTKEREVYEPVTFNVARKEPATMEELEPSGMTRSESAFDEVRSSPTLEVGSPAPAGLSCVAVYPWRAKKSNHLSFNEGDTMTVLMQQELWWQGSLPSGEQGWFPSSYVKTVNTSVPAASSDNSRLYDRVPSVTSPAAEESTSSRLYDQVPGESTAAADIQPPAMTERYLALHDYQSEMTGDLVFTAGELVVVTSKEGGDWWTGTIADRTGIFPANYVGLSSEQAEPKAASPVAAPTVVIPAPMAAATAAAASSQLKEIGKVIAVYEASGQEQLSLKLNQLIHIKKKSASGWWEGELMAKGQKKQIGWFPKDYIKLLPTSSGKASRPSTPATLEPESPRSKQPTPVPAPVVVQQVKVLASYPYTAQNEDELTFEQGDIITIVNKNDPDWWMGQLGEVAGVFPANYVQSYTEPLSEDEKKRQQAIEELMNTEETYVNDMVIALEAFYKPLQESKMMPESELNAIFVNWKELIHCNRKLVNAFKVRRTTCGQEEPINIIGDVLVENFPNMTPYIRFCSRQLYAAQLLQKRVETDSEARQFISKCQQDSRVHGMPLSSYILKPMQRITKYPLLVSRIQKHTMTDHPDYQYISEAASRAQELANQVNEGVREEDNSDKLEWVQNHVSCDGLTENITFNSLTNSLGQRKFVYSGVLCKLRSGRELYAFLFNDFLLFTTAVSSASAEKVFQLDVKGVIFKMYKTPVFLNEVSVREPVNLEKPDTDNVCFQLCHIESIIDIKCATTTERNAWIKRLTLATEAALSMEKVKRERAKSLVTSPMHKGIGRILVIIMEGISLLASDANGKSDPYCEVSMGTTLHKTKVMPNTLNPKWNSSMQFPIKSVEDDVLCFTVFDQDRFSPNDFLGRTELRVKDILRETREKRGPILKYARLQEVNTGDIVVKLDLQLYSSSVNPAPRSQRRPH